MKFRVKIDIKKAAGKQHFILDAKNIEELKKNWRSMISDDNLTFEDLWVLEYDEPQFEIIK